MNKLTNNDCTSLSAVSTSFSNLLLTHVWSPESNGTTMHSLTPTVWSKLVLEPNDRYVLKLSLSSLANFLQSIIHLALTYNCRLKLMRPYPLVKSSYWITYLNCKFMYSPTHSLHMLQTWKANFNHDSVSENQNLPIFLADWSKLWKLKAPTVILTLLSSSQTVTVLQLAHRILKYMQNSLVIGESFGTYCLFNLRCYL